MEDELAAPTRRAPPAGGEEAAGAGALFTVFLAETVVLEDEPLLALTVFYGIER